MRIPNSQVFQTTVRTVFRNHPTLRQKCRYPSFTGATNLYLGKMAELGPLDVQVFDPDREGHASALDEVQALERLQAFSLEAFDRTMLLLVGKTGKKVETLLPMTLKYVTDLMRPLLEKIDAVHYTQMSRALKVAEEYAIRLLQPKYTKAQAKRLLAT